MKAVRWTTCLRKLRKKNEHLCGDTDAQEERTKMERYVIVIPARNRSFTMICDEGAGMKLETLQQLVGGPIVAVPAALDAASAKEEADRLVLVMDEEGRAKRKGENRKATNIAPADLVMYGKRPLVGACVLMFQRGDALMGFAKHVAEEIRGEWA